MLEKKSKYTEFKKQNKTKNPLMSNIKRTDSLKNSQED